MQPAGAAAVAASAEGGLASVGVDMDLRLGRWGSGAGRAGCLLRRGARYRPLGGARGGGAAAGVSPPRGRVRAVVACLGVRRAGLSPRAPGGGGEPRAARPRTSTSAPHEPPAPRLQPVFLWARQHHDGTIQEVRCEDYDAHNRIRIVRTASGWRVIPRTETYDLIRVHPPLPPPPPPQRRRRKRKRRSQKPSWPVRDLESHIPSHTIAIPRAAESTPLESLLAVAELELSQQTSEPFGFPEAPPPVDMPFEPPPEPKPPDDRFYPTEPARSDVDVEYAAAVDSHVDLFETISEAHYLPELSGPHDEALLESLVEKGCEDNQILGQALDKLAHLVSGGDYAEEEEDMLLGGAPVADIIDRLEQSLESPGRSSMSAAQGLLNLHHLTPDAFPQPERPEPLPQEPLYDQIPEETTAELYTESVPETHESYENKTEDDPPLPDLIEALPSEITCAELKTEECNDKSVDAEELCAEQTEPEEMMPEISTMDLVKELEDTATIDELVPTDLSIKHPELESVPIVPEAPNVIEDNISEKSDEQPKDLSVHRRMPTPHASPRRIDIPRAPSRESDAMQSPQPSGIPAIPSSPEIFTMPPTKSKQTLFLETLLSSPSPKMYTSEVTITKQQSEPLNLGKHRKSASPTVSSCSDEMRKVNKEYGEPREKRLRRESTEDLAKISKVFNKSSEEQHLEAKDKRPEKLNISVDETSPLKQFQVLKSGSDFSVPDPLLIPKDKLNLILANPWREIPALLLQRPELRIPEAFAYPAVLQDPDILVISLAQLENILENDAKKHSLSKSKENKPTTTKSGSSSEHRSTPQPDQATNPKPIPSMDALAGDIDAATTAALNQMLWLPYFSQLEAMAACSQNMDFLKALNSTGHAGQNYPELAQMFNPNAARFMGQGGFPMMPSMDYDNRLQFAMWQEAMNHANAGHAAQRPKPLMEAQIKDMASKSSDVQNPYVHSTKNPQSKSHTSARTSPITHNYNQRSHHPFLQGMYSGMNPTMRPPMPLPGLQIPYFNPNMMGSQRSPRTGQTKSPTSPYYQNNNYLQSVKDNHRTSGSQESPRPRISVKSLQNLMEPAGSGTGPSRRPPAQASSAPGRRREEPEVGSTTPGEPSPHIPPHIPPHHDPASFHLWHPLFGNQKSYHSPWSWTTVTATGD